MSKHTAGPWFVLDCRQVGTEKISISTSSATQSIICRIKNYVSGRTLSAEDEANAHLIAAAPELLEALELIAGEPREDAATWMRGVARAAIAKARGEGV